ncbi:hypothetical protein [Desulfovibrio inopinatus]|uniref:hypothetical protein n=1 Tax=Desulfovibrio inopinatus TaxID=102109 RepID=UPI00040FC9AE|nr:hypothetical protein [Desulfovibrio inopinatus]
MDINALVEWTMPCLVAAQTGALDALKTKLKGASTALVKTVWDTVAARFKKDGESAVKELEGLKQKPDDTQAQQSVQDRLVFLLKDAAFLAELQQLFAGHTQMMDNSIHQNATANGINNTINQIVGNGNRVG